MCVFVSVYVCIYVYIYACTRIDINDVRQREMHTSEPLISETSSFEAGITIEKLKRYKSPGVVIFRQNCYKQKVIDYILKRRH